MKKKKERHFLIPKSLKNAIKSNSKQYMYCDGSSHVCNNYRLGQALKPLTASAKDP
jgi:hypothetical protein